MNNPQLSKEIDQKLQQFEAMEGIYPSNDWTTTLMLKLETSKSASTGSFAKESYQLVVVLLLVINIGFVVNVFNTSKTSDLISRNSELQKISSELLINPIVTSN